MKSNNNLVYEVHIAADTISKELIEKVTNDGFLPNIFSVHKGVQESKFRATLKNKVNFHLPVFDDESFNSYCEMLIKNGFRGTLINELADLEYKVEIDNDEINKTLDEIPVIKTSIVKGDEQKKSDIHISVNLTNTSEDALEYLDSLGIPYVERPNKTKRIYTLTTEKYEDGVKICDFLANHLKNLSGLKAKIYVERMINYFRTEDNDGVLPIVKHEDANQFLESVGVI